MNSQTFAQASGNQDDSDENAMPGDGSSVSSPSRSAGEKIPRRIRGPRKSASAFRTISEVADELDVQQHVLRFWETKFSQIRPLKRGGGRRFYRPEDIDLLKSIHHMLYTQGYTIKGVQKLLRDKGKKSFVEDSMVAGTQVQPSNANVNASAQAQPVKAAAVSGINAAQRSKLKATLAELRELREMVSEEE